MSVPCGVADRVVVVRTGVHAVVLEQSLYYCKVALLCCPTDYVVVVRTGVYSVVLEEALNYIKVAVSGCPGLKMPQLLQDRRGAALVRCGKIENVTFTSPEYTSIGASLMDDYQIGRYISHGVYYCSRKSSQTRHILRIVDVSHRRSKVEEIMHEVAMLNSLREQPNVVLVNDIFEDDSSIYMVVEDFGDGGTLVEELDTFGRLSETEAARFLKQLLSCVEYCHSMNIVHRDLRQEIIMLTKNADIDRFKIHDFSSAIVFDPEVGLSGKCGTPGYMAPEVSLCDEVFARDTLPNEHDCSNVPRLQVAKGSYGPSCDIWSGKFKSAQISFC